MPVISLKEWAGDTLSPTKLSAGQQMSSFLANIIGGYQKNTQDKQIRRAAATLLGIPEEQVPLGMTREDLVDLQKEKLKESLKPKKIEEWKPTTKEEVLELEREKTGLKTASESIKRVLGMQEKAAQKGWGLKVSPELPPEKQVEVARRLFTAKAAEPKEPKEPTIAPSTAIGILADPIKAAQIKRMYPEFYKRIEEIARKAVGAGTTTDIPKDNILDENW